MSATIAPDSSVITEVEFIRAGSTEALLEELRRRERGLAAESGFAASSLHVSDDDTIVIWRQWADHASWLASGPDARHLAEGEQVDRLGQRDIAPYEGVYVKTADGQPLSIEAGSDVATLIDVEVTDPERQGQILEFNVANSEAFSAQPGLRATAVLRGRGGPRIATYSQWGRVEDWIAAVKANAGGRVPGIEAIETVPDVNAVLQEASRAMGALPEYHVYRVAAVISP